MKSAMEEEDTLHKGTSTHTEHDNVSDDEVGGTPWDGNAADYMSNASTCPVTCSKSKDQNLTAQGFVIMSQGVNWLTNSWNNDSSWFRRS